MSYTYLAVDQRNNEPKAAFPRKHELARWVERYDETAPDSDPYRAYHLEFSRIRSSVWEMESVVTKLTREDLGLKP